MTTYHWLLALHLVFAVFAVGPLVGAATTAARGVKAGDAAAIASSARTIRIYSYVSVLVVLLGIGLVSIDSPFVKGQKLASFGDTYVWLSIVLWVVAMAVSLGVVVPALSRAGAETGGGTSTSSAGPIAGGGGVVAILFVVIIFLMVFQPGK